MFFCNVIVAEWRLGGAAPPTQLASCMKLTCLKHEEFISFFFLFSFLPFFCAKESSGKEREREQTHVRETSREAANSRLNGRQDCLRSLYVTATLYLTATHDARACESCVLRALLSVFWHAKSHILFFFSCRPDEARARKFIRAVQYL